MSNQAGLGLGDKVHTQEINEYPEELKQEYLFLSTWLKALKRHYGRSVLVRLIDPQSLVGFWKVLRYRIRGYPTLILERQQVFRGWDAEAAFHKQLQATLAQRGLPRPPHPFSLTPSIQMPSTHDG